jgi:hypothetical protein
VAPVIKEKPRVIRREKQQKIIIECNVESGGKPQCIWERESTIVKEDSRHQVIVREETKGQYIIALEIDKPSANDKGIYKLIAKNEKGEVTSQAIRVNIEDEEEEEEEEDKKKKEETKKGTKPKIIQNLRSEVMKNIY